MKLHKTQAIVAKDDTTYRVVNCGRQWGKTTLAVFEMIACAYAKKDREIAYFATTHDQARNIAWSMLKNYSQPAWAKSPNETRLELFLKTQDGGRSRISLRGYENVETARGQQFDFLVPDEVSQMKNWEYNWQAVLEPTLAFRRGKSLFISTPQGFNHFHKMYEQGQDKNNKLWKSWHFTSYDNPFLPIDRIEQAKKDSTEDYFSQEYMADFRKFTGLAHKPWDRDIHWIEKFDVPRQWHRGRGFDYGSTHYTASPRIAIDPDDNWFVENSYLDGKRDIESHAQAIKATDYGLDLVISYGDPSGGQWFKEFDKYNLHIQQANKQVGQGAKGWVEFCVEKVNERLKPIPGHTVILPDGRKIENAPRMFVLKEPSNENFVKQIENLKWRETAGGDTVSVLDESGDPTRGHFDLMAALRYFAVSYRKQEEYKPNYQEQQKAKQWKIGA